MNRGDRYNIRNYNLNGKEIIEGVATLTKQLDPCPDRDVEYWTVKFDNGDVVDRCVRSEDLVK